MEEVRVDINEVVRQLGAKIAELEMQLAYERAANKAYQEALVPAEEG